MRNPEDGFISDRGLNSEATGTVVIKESFEESQRIRDFCFSCTIETLKLLKITS